MFETPSANCASVGETQQTRPFEVKGINRAVYDVTNKPPGTIEGK